MNFTRRDFIKGGVSAFTFSFAAPGFISDLAQAQGAASRNLVVLYLSGGNDWLSTVVPYTDPFYYSRRPSLAIPAGNVLQIGSDANGKALGLHPRLTGLKQIFDAGHLALVQRTGYENQSRSHFLGTDIWSTADPRQPSGTGWLGRYLDTLPAPIDPLVAWNTARETPRTLLARSAAVPAIPNTTGYTFGSPNGTGAEAQFERQAALRIASHVPVDRPHLSFVNANARSALATIDRVATVNLYSPSVTYPNNGFGQALRAVAGAIARSIGTKVFWVTTGGYDTHASQAPLNGNYNNLMAVLNDALFAFYTDLKNQGLLAQTLIIEFSEFGRRISENSTGAAAGTDHGAASLMFLMGGSVSGGIYGTAPDLNPNGNPTLENNSADVRFETDFRSVYASVIDRWLGSNSMAILGADFRRDFRFLT